VSGPAGACNADELLAKLRPAVAYQQAELLHNSLQGMSLLVVWFVDPELKADAGPAQYAAQSGLAADHAMTLAHRLVRSDPCVAQTFTHVNPVVVDASYNDWFSGGLQTDVIPTSAELSAQQRADLEGQIEGKYVRQQAYAAIPAAEAGACTWAQVRERLPGQVGAARPNVSFYPLIDADGVSVYAQWPAIRSADQTGALDLTEVGTFTANMMAVAGLAEELKCLTPPVGKLYISIVDETGTMKLMGLLPRAAILSGDMQQLQYQVFGETQP
jgi:hypothetical protein